MPDEPTELLYDAEKKRRIALLRLPSGMYTYREERYFKNEAAEGWASLGGRASYYADLETVKREVRENVPWYAKKEKLG